MSHAGQAGSWLAVLLLYLAVPMDTAGRVMLVCAAIGSAVFAGLIEWPVLRRTRLSGNPLLELARIDRAGLYRSAANRLRADAAAMASGTLNAEPELHAATRNDTADALRQRTMTRNG